MSRKASRKIHGFSDAQKRELLALTPFCIKCKKEKATEADHILSLDFIRWARLFHVTTNSLSNGNGLCGKCHSLKNQAENKIDPADPIEVANHYFKWYGIAFTPGGKRRTMMEKTVSKNATFARKIHRAKSKARQAKAAGNLERVKHYHRLAAKIRRQFKTL